MEILDKITIEKNLLKLQSFNLLLDPSPEDMARCLPQYLIPKITRHLDKKTGDYLKGEFQCVSIEAIVYNQYMVDVFYQTLVPPDGEKGSHFMRFFSHSAAMRCLAVTQKADHLEPCVIMNEEYRRMRGEWVRMLPAGGMPEGSSAEVLVNELFEETGCQTTPNSKIKRLSKSFMDDGIFSDQLNLLTIDNLERSNDFSNIEEGIKKIHFIPFTEWKKKALEGKYDDIFSVIFAARCDINSEGSITISGTHEKLN